MASLIPGRGSTTAYCDITAVMIETVPFLPSPGPSISWKSWVLCEPLERTYRVQSGRTAARFQPRCAPLSEWYKMVLICYMAGPVCTNDESRQPRIGLLALQTRSRPKVCSSPLLRAHITLEDLTPAPIISVVPGLDNDK